MYKLYMRLCDLIVIFIEPTVQTIKPKQFPHDRYGRYCTGFSLRFKSGNPIRAPT